MSNIIENTTFIKNSNNNYFNKHQWHAFYSEKQKTQIINFKLYRDNQSLNKWFPSSFYRTITGEKVEVTCVFDIINHPEKNDCKLYFDDYIYLGIVDKWLSN